FVEKITNLPASPKTGATACALLKKGMMIKAINAVTCIFDTIGCIYAQKDFCDFCKVTPIVPYPLTQLQQDLHQSTYCDIIGKKQKTHTSNFEARNSRTCPLVPKYILM